MNDTPYTTEKGTVKRATRAAAQRHPKAYKLLNDSSLARHLLQSDTGITANRARDYIRHEIQLRSANANGGINAAAHSIRDVERYSKWLKRAGVIGLTMEAGTSGARAYDAYSKGDTKGGNVEIGKGAGGIVFGAGGGALAAGTAVLIFGAATGGAGLIIIGAAAVVGGYLAGEKGKAAGEWAANEINERAFK